MAEFLVTIFYWLLLAYRVIMLIDCIRLREIGVRYRVIWGIVIAIFDVNGLPIGALLYHGSRRYLLKAARVDKDSQQKQATEQEHS